MKKKLRRKANSRILRKAKPVSHKKLAEKMILKLYITGTTPHSQRALSNIKRICEEHLDGRYELNVIDIYQSPALAKDEQIIAAPTLIKVLPSPLRRLIGDLSNEDRVLLGLDVKRVKKK